MIFLKSDIQQCFNQKQSIVYNVVVVQKYLLRLRPCSHTLL